MTSPTPELTALAAFSGLGLTLAALALGAAVRRRSGADRVETARRLDTLTARVAALESRTASEPEPESRTVSVPVSVPVPVPVRRADRPSARVPAGPTLISVPNLSAGPAGSTSTGVAALELGRRYAAIWERADAGDPAETIARDTGQPIGQVELILGLKRRRPAHAKDQPS